jgi:hypothetical protein
MANWKKVIVSGSNAILNQLTVGTNQQIAVAPASTFLSGSFSGSFQGNGAGLTAITLDNSLSTGAGLNGSSFNGSSAQTWSVNSGSMLPYYSGSIFGTVSGDILITAGGIATIQANSVALGTDTTGNFMNDIAAGSGIAVSHTPAEGSTGTITLKNAGSLTNNTLVKWNAGSTQLTNSLITDDGTTVTVGGNLIVSGVITGSATYINSTNTAITDQFVLLASGSSSVVDGGIIVQNGAATGEAFYWENNAGGTARWAIASNVSPNTVTVSAAEYMVTAVTNSGAPSTAPTYGGSSVGYGNIYVNNSNEDIYIYS